MAQEHKSLSYKAQKRTQRERERALCGVGEVDLEQNGLKQRDD